MTKRTNEQSRSLVALARSLGMTSVLLLVTCHLSLVTAVAQGPALTTVKDTVYLGGAAAGSGTPVASGTVVISWQPFLSADSKPVFGGSRTYSLTSGALAVMLVPNAGATPSGTSYTVRYYPTSTNTYREEYWVVPASTPIASPGAPVVTQAGTPGTTTYYYWVSAANATGETLLGPSGVTTTSHATLDVTNYNIVDPADVSGATLYHFWRTTTNVVPSGSCTCYVGSSATSTKNDQSNTLTVRTVPIVNDTDPELISAVRRTSLPSPIVEIAATQVIGTAIVANPGASTTQTITAALTSGVPLQIKGRAGNTSNVFEVYDNAATPLVQAYSEPDGDVVFKRAPLAVLDDAVTSTFTNALTLRHTTTGTPADGIGVRELYQSESADETPSDLGALDWTFTDRAAGSEDSRLSIKLRVAGAAISEQWQVNATSLLASAAGHDLCSTGARCDVFAQSVDLSGNFALAAGNLITWAADTTLQRAGANLLELATGDLFQPQTTGQDLGTTSLRWDVFAGATDTSTLIVGASGTSITKHLSGTASLDFTALAANACETLTITVTGAADGNTATLGVPDALADVDGATERTTFFAWVSATNTVSVRRCNITGTVTAEPSAATVRADVWQH